jgi:predicted dehydrogenase
MSSKIRIGVIGAGIIAQVMHLNFLRELRDQYEIAAICDLAPESAQRCGETYGIAAVHSRWQDLLEEPLDAVMILTSGSHAPMAIAAAEKGMHVFTEKPMCFSAAEGLAMVAAADKAGVILMVGYPKRYDGAYARFREEVGGLAWTKLLRVTTCESPFFPYVTHLALTAPGKVDPDVLAAAQADAQARAVEAIGTDDPFYVRQYREVLLDTLVHEINSVRGVLGEPDSLDYVDMRDGALDVAMTFGSTKVAIHWLDLPGMTRYLMEFAAFDDNGRVTLSFPSPFLRTAPTILNVERGTVGATDSFNREEITNYESAFKTELKVFAEAIATGVAPETNGLDGARDIAMCQAIIHSARTGEKVMHPTQLN